MTQVAERIIGVDEHTDTANLLQNLSLDSQTKQSDAQPPHFDGEATDAANDVTVSDPTSENNNNNNNSTPADVVVDPNMYYLHNGYPPQHYFYGAYDGPVGEWDEYRFINPEGVEIPGGGVYSNDRNSVIYHPNYGYPPHMHYGPYSPAGGPVPSMGADGQIYSPQPFPYSGPFYQPPVPPGAPYTPSMTPPLPQPDVSTSSTDQVNVESVAANGNSNANSNGGPLGTLPNYPIPSAPSNGSYSRGVVPGSSDVFRPPSSWVDGPPGSDGHMRPSVNNGMLSVPRATSPGPLGPNIRPMPPMMHHMQAMPPQRPPTGVGSAPVYLNRMYPNCMYPQNNSGRTNSGFGQGSFDSRANGRGWNGFEKGKGRGRGNGTLYGYSEGMDVLNEQNRGPRTARIRNQRVATGPWQIKGQNVIANGRGDEANSVPNRDQYNRPEFVIKHSDAKFFIIKSYSEDDIHKSIKYSIWASTPNGNKKLDSAYKESQEKPAGCPIFLFFSVNASGQFCGVAEMIGPVDFNQSVDYWQQDKWNGKFPVKWHIVKDIPNNQLRHITLENNDSKPVTNSRDTQEVMLEKGIEMLKIFKDYVSKTSILDDFIFYEGRQKAMQEKRARQLQKQASSDGNGKPRDVKTGGPSLEENNLKARLQQSADRNNHKVTSADERSFPGSPGDAWKGGKPTLLKREVNGNAVDKQVQTNGS